MHKQISLTAIKKNLEALGTQTLSSSPIFFFN